MALTFNERFASVLQGLIDEEVARLTDILLQSRNADLSELRLLQGRADGFLRAKDLIPIALSIASGESPLHERNA